MLQLSIILASSFAYVTISIHIQDWPFSSRFMVLALTLLCLSYTIVYSSIWKNRITAKDEPIYLNIANFYLHGMLMISSILAAYGQIEKIQAFTYFWIFTLIYVNYTVDPIFPNLILPGTGQAIRKRKPKKGHLTFAKTTLKHKLWAFWVFRLIQRCLKAADAHGTNMCFTSVESEREIQALAKFNAVYRFENQSIVKYYYYSEPGNPFLSETYESLSDLVYSIVSQSTGDMNTASMLMAIAPAQIPPRYKEIQTYLNQQPEKRSMVKNILIGMEIKKFLSGLTLTRVDRILGQQWSKKLDANIFKIEDNNSQIPKSQFFGQWSGYQQTRNYQRQVFFQQENPTENNLRQSRSTDQKTSDNETVKRYQYKIERIIRNMIITTVEPLDDGFKGQERLILSKDRQSLRLYDHNGKYQYHRVKAAQKNKPINS